MRQLWRALHRVPQLLLVQPEQLGYDLAFALALLPLVVAAIVFFMQQALLLYATAFLAGIVCLLALRLARLTFGLPAWVGFKATHPLVASILIACFFPPKTPAWVAATAVILFVAIDTVLWPQLRRVMIHPALIVFGLLYLAERQLGIGFVKPFDGVPFPDPLLLWHGDRFWTETHINAVTLYVGNIAGPIGVTSMAAVLIGTTYLWYARKISLGIVGGFLLGIAASALVLRSDPGFQLACGSALFIAAYIAADRRRVSIAEPYTFLFGLAAGIATMILRWYGAGLQSAWMAFLGASLVVTVFLRVQGLLRGRPRTAMPSVRTLALESGRHEPRPVLAPIRSDVRQPVMAAAPVRTGYSRAVSPSPGRGFDRQNDPNDLVRQMRRAATQGPSVAMSMAVLLAALLLLNPVGLWLTWRTGSFGQTTKLLLSAASVLWYLGAAGLTFALLHR